MLFLKKIKSYCAGNRNRNQMIASLGGDFPVNGCSIIVSLPEGVFSCIIIKPYLESQATCRLSRVMRSILPPPPRKLPEISRFHHQSTVCSLTHTSYLSIQSTVGAILQCGGVWLDFSKCQVSQAATERFNLVLVFSNPFRTLSSRPFFSVITYSSILFLLHPTLNIRRQQYTIIFWGLIYRPCTSILCSSHTVAVTHTQCSETTSIRTSYPINLVQCIFFRNLHLRVRVYHANTHIQEPCLAIQASKMET